jgi:hypothetical protein
VAQQTARDSAVLAGHQIDQAEHVQCA